MPAATLLPELLTTGGALPNTGWSAQKSACRTKKSGNGVWWVHAALPPHGQSTAAFLRFAHVEEENTSPLPRIKMFNE